MTEALPSAISAERLGDVLRRAGALDDAGLGGITVLSARNTVLSRIIRLGLAYDRPAPGAPSTLILKTGFAGSAGAGMNVGRREVAFYTDAAGATPAQLLPRCYEAHWDPAGDWHLLLEDLTDTHAIATVWPVPPDRPQCELILETLARFHAAWWDDPRLGVSVGAWLDDQPDQRLRDLAKLFGQFADRLGDRLPADRRRLFERFLAAAPRLHARYRRHRDMTIMHGDAHVWNCLLPTAQGSGDARLFDWDSWRPEVATEDLTYMMAMHWYPDRRRRLERPLLDRYHAALTAHGVQGYGRDALQEDYRLSVLWQLRRPVWQAAHDLPPLIWWNNFERIMLAVDDLGCAELLD